MEDFTKVARPLVTFVGVAVFALNYCLIPIILRFMDKVSTPFEVPSEWWVSWFCFLGVYSAGRSVEKIISEKSAKQE
jgi:hypothetical protein